MWYEKKGGLRNQKNDRWVNPQNNPKYWSKLVETGIVKGGMVPKLENSMDDVKNGVKQVIITEAGELGKDSGNVITV